MSVSLNKRFGNWAKGSQTLKYADIIWAQLMKVASKFLSLNVLNLILDSEVTVLLFSFSENYFEGQEDDTTNVFLWKMIKLQKKANVRKVEMWRTKLHYLDSRSHSSQRIFQNIVADWANNDNRPHFYSFSVQKWSKIGQIDEH